MGSDLSHPPAKVLLVDDHAIVREGLLAILSTLPEEFVVVAQAGTSRSALELASRHRPDLIISDFFLGDGGDGARLIQDLKAYCSSTKILVLSLSGQFEMAERALRAGADGFLGKSEGTDGLIEACRQVLQGKRYASKRHLEQIIENFCSEGNQSAGIVRTLSERELHVFQLFAVFDDAADIARKLGVSPSTVITHRERIRQKLGLGSTTDVAKVARKWVGGLAQ